MHRSASGLGVQNERWRMVSLNLFTIYYLNPCFCLSHVVETETFLFSVHRLFTETDRTIEDFHYRTV